MDKANVLRDMHYFTASGAKYIYDRFSGVSKQSLAELLPEFDQVLAIVWYASLLLKLHNHFHGLVITKIPLFNIDVLRQILQEIEDLPASAMTEERKQKLNSLLAEASSSGLNWHEI